MKGKHVPKNQVLNQIFVVVVKWNKVQMTHRLSDEIWT